MINSLAKSTPDQVPCVLCGKTDALRRRFVAFGLMTFWNRHQNAQDRQVFTQDDIRVGHLTLCGNCISEQFRKHLDRHNKTATAYLGAALGFAAIGVLAALNAQYQWWPMPTGAMHSLAALIAAIVTVLLLFGGVIALMMLPNAIMQKLRWARSRESRHSASLFPDRDIDVAFAEAGKTLLEQAKGRKENTSDPAPLDVPTCEKLVPSSDFPAKKGDAGIYSVKHYETIVLGSAGHPDEAIKSDWVSRYVELGRVTDKARLAAAYDRESLGVGGWFLYFTVLILVLLMVSAFSWEKGDETTGFLLIVPVALFPAFGGIIAWCIAVSCISDYKRIFGRLRGCASVRRFLIRTAIGILLILAGTGYLIHTRKYYISTHPLKLYETSGVIFGSPREWRKLSDDEIERMRPAYEGDILKAFEPEKGALFLVTRERSNPDPSKLLNERRNQVDALIAKEEVTKVHKLQIMEINAHPAVYLDVDRRDSGRGCKVDIRLHNLWIGLALILPRGEMEKYDKTFESILSTVKPKI